MVVELIYAVEPNEDKRSKMPHQTKPYKRRILFSKKKKEKFASTHLGSERQILCFVRRIVLVTDLSVCVWCLCLYNKIRFKKEHRTQHTQPTKLQNDAFRTAIRSPLFGVRTFQMSQWWVCIG